MPTTPPKVAIITVNFNQTEATEELLRSLRAFPYTELEIWVVDNGSGENPSELVERFPEIKYIRSDLNLGFAGGNNLAVTAAEADYYFFINNDTEVTEGLIERLVEDLEQHPDWGGVSPRILYHHTPDTLQYAGATKMHPLKIGNESLGYMEKDSESFHKIVPTEFLHGAAMMIRGSVIKQVGPMDDVFFLYYEEYDWCERIKRAGYPLYVDGRVAIYHKESLSTGKASPLKTYYLTRNRRLWARRNQTGVTKVLSGLYFYLVVIPKNLLKFTISREFKHLKATWQAATWNLSHRA
ncbi:glycosyltransferase family 2 protein [Cryomorphaceae bacterium]|nr:glycosyltransferase family 2 protein [Cryomorphaceae bacterium]